MTGVELQSVLVIAAAPVILAVRLRTGHAPPWLQRRLSQHRETRQATG